jgi:hypothetical protein
LSIASPDIIVISFYTFTILIKQLKKEMSNEPVFKEVQVGEFEDLLKDYDIVELNVLDYYTENVSFPFPNSGQEPRDIDITEELYSDLSRMKKGDKGYVESFFRPSNRRIVYSGTIANKDKEGRSIRYSTVVFSVIPTLNDSEVVQYPEICACHGDKCRIFDTVNGYLCESCYGEPEPYQWARYSRITTLECLNGIIEHVHRVFICEDILTVDLSKDSNYIKKLRKKKADLEDRMNVLKGELKMLTSEFIKLGYNDADIVE